MANADTIINLSQTNPTRQTKIVVIGAGMSIQSTGYTVFRVRWWPAFQ